MFKFSLLLGMAFLAAFNSLAQGTKILEAAQQQQIEQRITSKNILFVADSLFADYRREPFTFRQQTGGYEEGLYYLRKLYERAVKAEIRPVYAQQKSDETDALSRQEARAAAEFQYEKLKRIAGEYQQQGNLEKARELYLRAITIKPGDQDAVKKLEAVDLLLKEKGGK